MWQPHPIPQQGENREASPEATSAPACIRLKLRCPHTVQTAAAAMADFLGKALGSEGVADKIGKQAGEFDLIAFVMATDPESVSLQHEKSSFVSNGATEESFPPSHQVRLKHHLVLKDAFILIFLCSY